MKATTLEILRAIATAPSSQCDPSITKKIAEIDDKMTADQLKAILDECAYASLASDFFMFAMDRVWRDLQEQEANGQSR